MENIRKCQILIGISYFCQYSSMPTMHTVYTPSGFPYCRLYFERKIAKSGFFRSLVEFKFSSDGKNFEIPHTPGHRRTQSVAKCFNSIHRIVSLDNVFVSKQWIFMRMEIEAGIWTSIDTENHCMIKMNEANVESESAFKYFQGECSMFSISLKRAQLKPSQSDFKEYQTTHIDCNLEIPFLLCVDDDDNNDEIVQYWSKR